MRIVFLSWSAAYGGAEKHYVELIERLDLSQYQPVILCFGADPFSRILNDQLHLGIQIETGLQLHSFFRTWNRIRKTKPDRVVFIAGVVGAFPWYIFLAARLSGAKHVCAVYHNFSVIPETVPNTGNRLLYLAKRAFGWRARHLLGARIAAALTYRSVCISERLRDRLIGTFGFPEDRVVTVLNGVDLNLYSCPHPKAATLRKELGVGPDEILMAVACRLVKAKGVDILLRAMDLLREEVTNLKCVIVGEGPCSDELYQLAGQLGLSSRVVFVGFQGDVRPYLQAADFLVSASSPTWVECFGMSTLEAMACGVPSIASNAGGVPELVFDEQDGLLVAPGSVEELRAAIKRMATDSALRRRMGERAREKVRSKFDLERWFKEFKANLLE